MPPEQVLCKHLGQDHSEDKIRAGWGQDVWSQGGVAVYGQQDQGQMKPRREVREHKIPVGAE